MNPRERVQSRRDFLRGLAGPVVASAIGATGRAGAPRATADAMILLWMAGGQCHTETWDPKRFTPYRRGMEARSVGSTFRAIPTTVDGLRISEGLPHCSRVMHLGAMIKTFQPANLGFIIHARHQSHFHTGYVPPQSAALPSLGGVLARLVGPREPNTPANVLIGQRFDIEGVEAPDFLAFHTAGFLGDDYGPMLIPDPARAAEALQPRAGTPRGRSGRRLAALHRAIDTADPLRQLSASERGYLQRLDAAHALVESPASRALDLTLEPRASFDAYNIGRFGLGCLLARRLVESGARFIEVTTEYVPFGGWDTHDDGHRRAAEMMSLVDAPIARLITDLEERGMLDRTLVVVASEFSRDMLLEGRLGDPIEDPVPVPKYLDHPRHYGLHRHFTGASTVIVFGGGARRGYVHGETADERPFTAIKDPVTVSDLHATFYTMMGVRPDVSFEHDGRPFPLTEGGRGRPIRELLA
jgi:hypothetical protein